MAAAVEEQIKDQEREDSKISVDVDLENTMEWEVETEPAPMPEPEPVEEDPYAGGYYEPGIRVARAYNKHIYTWLFSYLLGIFGVDRFCRGQTFLGVLKLVTFGGLGFWYLADLIIAIVKSYGGGFRDQEDLLFDYRGNYIY